MSQKYSFFEQLVLGVLLQIIILPIVSLSRHSGLVISQLSFNAEHFHQGKHQGVIATVLELLKHI